MQGGDGDEFKEEPTAETKEIQRLKAGLLEVMEKIVETAKYDRFKEEDEKLSNHDCQFTHLEG